MLRFAFRNLLTRPVRSLLSLLGLTVAIAGMVGLFSVADGIDAMVTSTFERIPGLVVMQPGAPIPLFSRLPAAWGAEIAKLPEVRVINDEVWARANVIEGKAIISPPRFLFGTDISSRLKLEHCVYRNVIVEGRFLTPDDKGTLNTVISRQIAEEFKLGVGDAIHVDGHALRIVGIYHTGSLLLDVALVLDIDQARRLGRMDGHVVSCFYIEMQDGVDREELVKKIQDLFRGREPEPWGPGQFFGMALPAGGTANPLGQFFTTLDRLIKSQPARPDRTIADSPPAAPSSSIVSSSSAASVPTGEAKADTAAPAVEVRSAEDWNAEFERFVADLDIFLVLITGIGVTIAILSIVNTMLMSVTERFIEFGILKANGWTNRDVLKLVTLESACLGLGGGLLGSGFGWIATQVINASFPTRIHLYAGGQLLVFAVLFSTALGILGGLYPAIWAARMMPMDAIRRG